VGVDDVESVMDWSWAVQALPVIVSVVAGAGLILLILRRRGAASATDARGMQSGLDVTKDLWSKKASAEDHDRRRFVSWMNHPVIEKHINRKISGDAGKNWMDFVKAKYAQAPLSRGLSLGCGAGGLERHGLFLDICHHFDAYDVAPGAIAVAKNEAEKVGFASRVHYEARDLNAMELPEGAYDIAFACQSAHHFTAIEHIFGQVKRALKPGGLFILNEFVGPTRFQWTDRQLELVNSILRRLPADYRRLVLSPETVRDDLARPTIEQMIAIDPSEAVRSGELVHLVETYFTLVERIDFGGTILQLLLQDIAGNFNPDRPEDVAMLDEFWKMEDDLIRDGGLPSDFTLLVARA
jgi:SAM-dependent methyltransferase